MSIWVFMRESSIAAPGESAMRSSRPHQARKAASPLREGAPGLSDYELLNWFGMFAPSGTPEAVLTKLNEISNKALSGDALANKLKVQGIVPKPMSLAEFKSFVESETAKFGSIIADANIKLGN